MPALPLIIVSHDLAVVRRVADEVLVLYGGRVVERGGTAVTFSHPQHPYTRGLVAAIPTRRHARKQPLPVMTAGRRRRTGARSASAAPSPTRHVRGAAAARLPVGDVACHHAERIPSIGAA